jgi:hypothetical protein
MAQTAANYKFTPGPWTVRYFQKDNPNSDFFVEAKNNNMPELGYGIEIMGDDYGDHNGYPREQRQSDAQLISQAPNLIKALEEARAALIMTSLIDKSSVSKKALRTVEQAIKDATL